MDTLLIVVFGGMTRASVYFLIASGLTLVFGVAKVINFAHGSIFVLGMYITYSLVTSVFEANQYGFWFSLLMTPIILGVLGFILEALLLRRAYKKEHLIQLLITFGLVFILSDVYRIGWGVMPQNVPRPDILSGTLFFLNMPFPIYNIFTILFSIFIYYVLVAIVSRTQLGRLSRAVSFDGDMCQLLGINVPKMFSIIFSLGCILAGIGATLSTQLSSVNLGMETHITILAFILVIVGGVGSIKGAALASILIGLVEAFGSLFLAEMVLVLIYLVMVGVLLIRPFGILGRPLF
jgi:branched-subunit amino acid ABC-type transport system permease component